MAVRNIQTYLPFIQNPHWPSNLLKRLFDILISFLVLLLLAPLFGLIALAIRRDSPGPAFYRGPRLGRDGRLFSILKFRTMWETPASYQGPRVTAHDDDRITPLGRWLRDTKLNELPQFWNVLVGDMSLVGPRPEDPTIAKTWPTSVMKEIFSVRPGITSPASVQYHNEESLLSSGNAIHQYLQDLSPDKQRLDRLYVRHRSFWLDLDTLLWTALVLVPRLRDYSPPESLLFVGPITRLIRRHVSWFTIDLGITFLAFAAAGLLWRLSGPLNLGLLRATIMAAGFALLFSLAGGLLGANRISWTNARYTDVFDLLPAWLVATLMALVVNFAGATLGNTGRQIFPPGMLLVASGLALGGFVLARYRTRLLTGVLSRAMGSQSRARLARERVLIVGLDTAAQVASWLFDHPANGGKFWVVGFVTEDLFKQGMRIFGAPVLGTCRDLAELVRKHDIGLVALADDRLLTKQFGQIVDACAQASARLVVLPDLLAGLSDVIESLGVQSAGKAAPAIPLDCTPEKCSYALPTQLGACLHCLLRGNRPEGQELPLAVATDRV